MKNATPLKPFMLRFEAYYQQFLPWAIVTAPHRTIKQGTGLYLLHLLS